MIAARSGVDKAPRNGGKADETWVNRSRENSFRSTEKRSLGWELLKGMLATQAEFREVNAETLLVACRTKGNVS